MKLLQILFARKGIYTAADHFICGPISFLNNYLIYPLLAGCTQDEDPHYIESVFNDYDRTDKFDSDIWTNDERWSLEERNAALEMWDDTQPLPIDAAFHDIHEQQEQQRQEQQEQQPQQEEQSI